MTRVLVTGSAGFIGSRVAAALVAAGYEVEPVDVADPVAPRDVRVFCQSAGRRDIAVHCAAAVVAPGDKQGLAAAANLEIDAAFFAWAARTRPGRVVYFSSSCAYPEILTTLAGRKLAEKDIDLTRPRWPDGLYGWAKLTGEQMAFELAQGDTDVTVLRPFSVYGPGMHDGFAVRGFAEQVRRRANPLIVWGNAGQVRDFIHVSDVAAATVAAIWGDVNGPVNLGTGRGTDLRQLALMLAAQAGYIPVIKTDLGMPAGPPSLVADCTRMNGFARPQTSLEDGLTTLTVPDAADTC